MAEDKNNDNFIVDIPDIPLPAESREDSEIVKDKFEAAFRFAFVGCGQGGSRLAESFYKIGYRRVCAVNTTDQDLKGIAIPDANKLVIGNGEGGAGKEPRNGTKAAQDHYEDIYDLMRRSFGKEFDRVFVCIGAGGGTGSGACDTVIDIAHDIARSFKIEAVADDPVVGVIVSMPKAAEGGKVNANAHNVLDSLFRQVDKEAGRTISPLVILDNDRIDKIYPSLPVAKFWDMANRNISSLFHLFNFIAGQDSDFTTFDKADFKDLLQKGIVSFGACPISKWDEISGISHSIRDNLKSNVLVSGFDMNQSHAAGCVFIAHDDVLDKIPQSHLEHGFEMLSRIMQPGSVVHRGIYKGDKEGLVVYTMMGELGYPTARMMEISRIGDVTIEQV